MYYSNDYSVNSGRLTPANILVQLDNPVHLINPYQEKVYAKHEENNSWYEMSYFLKNTLYDPNMYLLLFLLESNENTLHRIQYHSICINSFEMLLKEAEIKLDAKDFVSAAALCIWIKHLIYWYDSVQSGFDNLTIHQLTLRKKIIQSLLNLEMTSQNWDFSRSESLFTDISVKLSDLNLPYNLNKSNLSDVMYEIYSFVC